MTLRLHLLAFPLLLLAACSNPQSPGGTVAPASADVLPAAATQGMPASAALHPHPAEIPLWPAAAPGSEAFRGKEEIISWRTEKDTLTGQSFAFPVITNIHNPSITPFLPARDKATGAAVIIAPGGGHQLLAINHEGYDVAQILADRGIAAFVLKYRLARGTTYPPNTYSIAVHALADGQRALRVVRAKAAEWAIDPNRIGFMGFSAGGEVATQVALNKPGGDPDALDPIDRLSCKMNFEALIYPGVSRLIQPTPDWPPVFLACSFDDRADIAGAPATRNASTRPAAQGLADVYLRYKAVGVPAELHIYSTGGHGFGARNRPIAESQWLTQFQFWLTDRHLLK